jgi:hypothetical protein
LASAQCSVRAQPAAAGRPRRMAGCNRQAQLGRPKHEHAAHRRVVRRRRGCARPAPWRRPNQPWAALGVAGHPAPHRGRSSSSAWQCKQRASARSSGDPAQHQRTRQTPDASSRQIATPSSQAQQIIRIMDRAGWAGGACSSIQYPCAVRPMSMENTADEAAPPPIQTAICPLRGQRRPPSNALLGDHHSSNGHLPLRPSGRQATAPSASSRRTAMSNASADGGGNLLLNPERETHPLIG